MKQDAVAPLVGAWIEILRKLMQNRTIMVAPLVGAWIEILKAPLVMVRLTRRSSVGAWIEMLRTWTRGKWSQSLLSWERGLKLQWGKKEDFENPRRSSRGSVD